MRMFKAKRVVLLILASLLASFNALGFDKADKLATKSVDRGQAFEWQEDGVRQTVFMSKSLVAEFPSSGQGMVKKAFPRAVVAEGESQGVRIWTVESKDIRTAITAIKNLDANARVSPVFYDEKGGRKRALPGGVIVRFDSTWDEKKAQGWIRDNGYDLVRVMGDKQKFYLINTGSGLESLEVANRISDAKVAKSVVPNWWVQVFPR